jgi:nucleotide-binding universal stress UspA family protein
MFRHILIATDGSDLAAKGLDTGLGLGHELKAKVTIVTAREPWQAAVGDAAPAFSFPVEEYDKAAAENAERILAAAAAVAKQKGVACETVHANGFPAEAIIETAKAKGCDLIVMSSHGRRGLRRLLLGSQASQVVALSTIPVLVCR